MTIWTEQVVSSLHIMFRLVEFVLVIKFDTPGCTCDGVSFFLIKKNAFAHAPVSVVCKVYLEGTKHTAVILTWKGAQIVQAVSFGVI